MSNELENLVKKNLKLDYVKNLDRVLYSVEYEGKLYSEAVPIEEFLKSCQKGINLDLVEEHHFIYFRVIQKFVSEIKVEREREREREENK